MLDQESILNNRGRDPKVGADGGPCHEWALRFSCHLVSSRLVRCLGRRPISVVGSDTKAERASVVSHSGRAAGIRRIDH